MQASRNWLKGFLARNSKKLSLRKPENLSPAHAVHRNCLTIAVYLLLQIIIHVNYISELSQIHKTAAECGLSITADICCSPSDPLYLQQLFQKNTE